MEKINLDYGYDIFGKENDSYHRDRLANAIKRWRQYGIINGVIKERSIPTVKKVTKHELEQYDDDLHFSRGGYLW